MLLVEQHFNSSKSSASRYETGFQLMHTYTSKSGPKFVSQDSKQVYWHSGIYNNECIAYDPPEAIEASSSNVLWLGLEELGAIDEELDIFIYQRDQMFIPNNKWVYGSYKQKIIMEPNTSYQYHYHVIQHELITLDQPAQRCYELETNSCNISACIMDYIKKRFNCSLPLLGNYEIMGNCRINDTLEALNFKNGLAEKAELGIFQETGCLPCCDRRHIELDLILTRMETKKVPSIWLKFGYRDAVYNLNEEYLVYDWDLFTADIGGYLGLILGFSLLSVYELLAINILGPNGMVKQWFKKKYSKVQDKSTK